MLKNKWSTDWVEEVFPLGSRSPVWAPPTVPQAPLRTWLHKSGKGGVRKWSLGGGKLIGKALNFWQGFVLWLKYAKKSFSGAFCGQLERSSRSWGIRTMCDGRHICGKLKLCCGYQVPVLASPWFPHLKKKKKKNLMVCLKAAFWFGFGVFLRGSLADT